MVPVVWGGGYYTVYGRDLGFVNKGAVRMSILQKGQQDFPLILKQNRMTKQFLFPSLAWQNISSSSLDVYYRLYHTMRQNSMDSLADIYIFV